jgi:hypothetical protein
VFPCGETHQLSCQLTCMQCSHRHCSCVQHTTSRMPPLWQPPSSSNLLTQGHPPPPRQQQPSTDCHTSLLAASPRWPVAGGKASAALPSPPAPPPSPNMQVRVQKRSPLQKCALLRMGLFWRLLLLPLLLLLLLCAAGTGGLRGGGAGVGHLPGAGAPLHATRVSSSVVAAVVV